MDTHNSDIPMDDASETYNIEQIPSIMPEITGHSEEPINEANISDLGKISEETKNMLSNATNSFSPDHDIKMNTDISPQVQHNDDEINSHAISPSNDQTHPYSNSIMDKDLTDANHINSSGVNIAHQQGDINDSILSENSPNKVLQNTSSDKHPESPKTGEIQDHIDNDAFSKLLEIDSKDDRELFETNDLEHEDIPKVVEQAHDEIVPEVENTLNNQPSNHQTTVVKAEDSEVSPTKTVGQSNIINNNTEGNGNQLPISLEGNGQNKTHDLANIESNLVQKLIHEKSSMEVQKRKNSIIPGMFHTNDLHMEPSHFESIQNTDNSAVVPQMIQPSTFDNEITTTTNGALLQNTGVPDEQPIIFAYARLDFQNFTFYVQTLHAIIGRRSENDTTHKVDVNLGPSKSISRRHAQIFYNFGTGRFELSVIGKNGAFVNEVFVERGNTVPLKNKTKIQIGQIPFQFVLPDQENNEVSDEQQEGTKKPKTKKTTAKKEKKVPAKKPAKKTAATKKTTAAKNDATKKKDDQIKSGPAPKKKKATPKPVVKKEKKPAKAPKKVYTLEEIPEQYRAKPAFSYSSMLTTCIRKNSSERGMSLSEIYAGIRELFPFYKYCPDGWQSSVRHNLSLNKSFRKVSKEGKGWLWGLDEVYISEREKQKQKQAELAKAKAEASQARLDQQNQNQKTKKATPTKTTSMKKQNISQTLAANRSVNSKITTSKPTDHQRTMKYLQGQLMILTKDRKGLSKQVIADILTQALAMTINQVTQAARNKGITGNPLTALMDKNPKHLNLILAAAVNAATAKVTNGKIKSLVNPTLPSTVTPNVSSTQPGTPEPQQAVGSEHPQKARSAEPSQGISKVAGSESGQNSDSTDNSFDPKSLSRFFQPRQQARPPSSVNATATEPITPLKRSIDDSSDESSDDSTSSSDNESGSNDEDADEDEDEDEDDDDEEDEDESDDDDENDDQDAGEDDDDDEGDDEDEDEGEDEDDEDEDENDDDDDDDDEEDNTKHEEDDIDNDVNNGEVGKAHDISDDEHNKADDASVEDSQKYGEQNSDKPEATVNKDTEYDTRTNVEAHNTQENDTILGQQEVNDPSDNKLNSPVTSNNDNQDPASELHNPQLHTENSNGSSFDHPSGSPDQPVSTTNADNTEPVQSNIPSLDGNENLTSELADDVDIEMKDVDELENVTST